MYKKPDQYKDFNIVPMRKDRSCPALEQWKQFQTKRYKGRIEYSKNYGVFTGIISDNLFSIDVDLPKELKDTIVLDRLDTMYIYLYLIKEIPLLRNTTATISKSGMPKFFLRTNYSIDFGLIEFHFKKKLIDIEIDHIEIRGNKHFNALHGTVNGRSYGIINKLKPKVLTREMFDQMIRYIEKISIIEEKYTKSRILNNTNPKPMKVNVNNKRKFEDCINAFPPCLKRIAIDNSLTHHTGNGHSMNRILCNYFFGLHAKNEIIHQAFYTHDPYKPKETQTQIESLKRGFSPAYLTICCSTIRNRGYCIECGDYRYIHHSIGGKA